MGYAFVFFDNPKTINLFKNFYKKFKNDPKNQHFVDHFMCPNWTITSAPNPSDILWDNYNHKKPHHALKDNLLNFFMLILTIFVSTPTRQADFIVKCVDFIFPGDNYDIMTSAMIIEILSITITNSVIIP